MKTAPFKFIILSLFILAVALRINISTHAQTAKTWVVCITAGTGCDFAGPQGIQQAIDAAASGDTVFVKAGDYDINSISGTMINISKNITFHGEGSRATILNGSQGTTTTSVISLFGTANQININNFKIIGNATNNSGDAGILLQESAQATITNVEIQNVRTMGIGLYDSTKATITFTDIHNTHDSGIFLSDSSQATITNNNLYANIDGLKIEGNGTLMANAQATIKFNSIYDNSNNGFVARSTANLVFMNNLVYNNFANSFYILLTGTGTSSIINNVFDFGDRTNLPGGQNVYIEGSNIVFENNLITNGGGKGLVTPSTNVNNITMQYNDSFGNAGGNYDIHVPDSRDYQYDPSYSTNNRIMYSLNTGSPAIDSGDPAIHDPDGSISDLGAYGGPEACGLNILLPGCGPTSPTPGGSGTPAPATTISPVACDRSHGDADCSGTVDMVDYLYYVRYNACINSPQANCLGVVPINVNLDVNGVGGINDMDRVVIITGMRGPVLPSNTITPPAQ